MHTESTVPGLWSPRLATNVTKRLLRAAGKNMALGRRESVAKHTADNANTNAFIEALFRIAPTGNLFGLVEFPTESGYGRKAVEASACPALRSRHGHVGRFIIARCITDNNDLKGVTGTLFADTTTSYRDRLSRTNFRGVTDSPLNISWLPDIESIHDASRTYPFGSEPSLGTIMNLVSASTVCTNSRLLTALEQQYNDRVASYKNDTTTLVSAIVSAIIPTQIQPQEQLQSIQFLNAI